MQESGVRSQWGFRQTLDQAVAPTADVPHRRRGHGINGWTGEPRDKYLDRGQSTAEERADRSGIVWQEYADDFQNPEQRIGQVGFRLTF